MYDWKFYVTLSIVMEYCYLYFVLFSSSLLFLENINGFGLIFLVEFFKQITQHFLTFVIFLPLLLLDKTISTFDFQFAIPILYFEPRYQIFFLETLMYR